MDETFDFVVIGGGGGGLAAALLMRSLGKSVVVLEKTDQVGGNTARSGGVMWIPNNRFLHQDGVAESAEKANAYLDAINAHDNNAPGATPARRRAYVAEAPNALDFLLDQGIKLKRIKYWPDYYDDAPGGLEVGRAICAELFDINQLGAWKTKLRSTVIPVPADMGEVMQISSGNKLAMLPVGLRMIYVKLTKTPLVTGGQALQGWMLKAALKANADLRVNAPVKEIIVENGRVTGVVVTQDGKDKRIGAGLGVLINAGGFSKSQKLRDQYLPGTKVEWSQTQPGDTGEIIEEAMRLGAAVAQMDATVGSQIATPPGATDMKPMLQSDAARPHSIVVDQSGQRYMNEAGSYVDFCDDLKKRDKISPAMPSWVVVDSQYTSKYTLMNQKGEKLDAMVGIGLFKKGETLDALAAACGMDASKLKASVERFNGFARAGKDEDFNKGGNLYQRWQGDKSNKPSPNLGTLEQGPFHAVQVFPGDVSTYGGVVTDEYARVLKGDGSVIAGLYATGTSTASAMGRREPAAGGSVGPSIVFGYVAAKHAAHAGNQGG